MIGRCFYDRSDKVFHRRRQILGKNRRSMRRLAAPSGEAIFSRVGTLRGAIARPRAWRACHRPRCRAPRTPRPEPRPPRRGAPPPVARRPRASPAPLRAPRLVSARRARAPASPLPPLAPREYAMARTRGAGTECTTSAAGATPPSRRSTSCSCTASASGRSTTSASWQTWARSSMPRRPMMMMMAIPIDARPRASGRWISSGRVRRGRATTHTRTCGT